MIVVHHLNNSRSQRVLWLLEELGLPYRVQRYERDARTMLAPPELRRVHPLGKSPVIEDEGLVLAESGAIVDYLAQRYGATQRLVRQIPVPDKVVEAILKLVRSARPGTGENAETDRFVAWGPGPRASQALMLAVRAKALIDGRLAPSVDNVIALAEPILKHRMALTFAARAEGEDLNHIIARLAASVE